MSQLRRLAKIYYVVGKYRLDNLIDQRRLPLAVKLALAPSKLFSNSKLSFFTKGKIGTQLVI